VAWSGDGLDGKKKWRKGEDIDAACVAGNV
jgi:hypothetical protein